jgi:nucleotide-binding universal stress UspA family protein
MSERIFVVPHDFTPAADTAVNNAINICKLTGASIALLHIVSKEAEVIGAELKLKQVIKQYDNSNISFRCKAIAGSIFSDIGRYAEFLNASAIIMATHGAQGMQKVFGSLAMKVIISTRIPFMVVQKETQIKDFSNIVFSIDHSSQSVQIATFTASIAKVFNAKIHVIAKKLSDVPKAKKIKNNLIVISRHLNKINVAYNLELLEDKGEWSNTIIDYAKNISSDMLAIAYDSERFMASKDKFSQALIFNESKLPTLIINAKRITHLYF